MIKTLPRVDFEDFHASLHPSTTVQSPDKKLAEENTELFLGVPPSPRALRGLLLPAFTSGRLSTLQKSLMSLVSPHSTSLSALFLWDFLFLILGCKLHEGRTLSNPLVMSLALTRVQWKISTQYPFTHQKLWLKNKLGKISYLSFLNNLTTNLPFTI